MTHDACRNGRILVTGSDGYIGSVLVPHLRDCGFDVVGWDTGWFSSCTLGSPPDYTSLRRDIRDASGGDLTGVDAIVHLAALSNDPVGSLNSKWTEEINTEGSFRLARLARDCGVRRFVFSSSCIMYGAAETMEVDETSPLDPRTDYARSKVEAEALIGSLADDRFSPVFLRNGTVYGYSPRMRLDTVLNNFVTAAMVDGAVVVRSDGKPWRPVVHINDLVRSIAHVLESPLELIHNEAFNNGSDQLNIRIGDLAHVVADVVPGTTVEICAEADADQRTYRASFAKFATTFPDFSFQFSPAAGARQLYDALRRVGFSRADIEADRFVRLRWLERLLSSGRLDGRLCWSQAEATPP